MDTTLTLERITYALDSTFGKLIYMSDVANESEEKRRAKFLSRALAAYSIRTLSEADPEQAAKAVTDSYKDQGIDAIYVDATDKAVYIVQSKWTAVPDQGDVEKFLSGVQALIRSDFSGFDEKIRVRESELKANFLWRSDNRVVLVLAYCNHQNLGSEAERAIQQYIDQQNNVGDLEVFSFEKLDIKRIYGRLSGSSNGKISFQIALREWGTIEDPHRAYYGQVSLSDIAAWSKYGKALFDKNLRFYRPSGEVNEAMERTILHAPDRFWYFNNGVTILCSSITKAVIGGDTRDYGVFNCAGVSVVNGAQTVGVVWDIAKKDGSAYLNSVKAKANVRILSLEGTPDGFGNEVTRATNTQNRIQNRDFAALDPLQHQLAADMAMDAKRYAFKSGDPDPKGDEGCNIEEATVALACANADISLAVQAKREVGLLWLDIERPPYKTLFNDSLTSRTMWRAVRILRTMESTLNSISNADDLPRGEMVAVHGRLFVLRRVFQDPVIASTYRDPSISDQQVLTSVAQVTVSTFREVCELVQKKYSGAYLATLFKNLQKCKELDLELSNPLAPVENPQGTLF